MSQYPRDEFDKVPETAARQGVHRERLVPTHSNGLALKILVGVLVLAVGLTAYFVFPRLGIGQGGTASSATSAPAPEPSTSESASAAPTEEPSSSPTPSPTPSPSTEPPSDEPTSAEPTPTASEPAAADRTQPVAVLNGTTVSGLASTAAGRLQVDGWNVTQIGNWPGEPLQGSIVLYNGEEQRASAEALAQVLGIPTVQGGAGFSPALTVVVGPGFQ